MGSIASVPGASALALLTTPGAPLSRVSSKIPQLALDSATPTEPISLNSDTEELPQVNALFGAQTPDLLQSGSRSPEQALLDAAYGTAPGGSQCGRLVDTTY
jgi:hypothetical protein